MRVKHRGRRRVRRTPTSGNRIRAIYEFDAAGKPLWWSEDGWVEESLATVFSDEDRVRIRLPLCRLKDGSIAVAGEWVPPSMPSIPLPRHRYLFDD